MLVFQVLLFGGYAYAQALNRFLGLRLQIALHCGLLLLPTSTLPITPSADWKPTSGESPTWMIMLLLMCKVGAPYFLLSSTGPLLQSWLGQSKLLEQPYRLYSLSNVGSMLALLSFPFVIEPALFTSERSYIWSISFAVFAVAYSRGTRFTEKHGTELRVPLWVSCDRIVITLEPITWLDQGPNEASLLAASDPRRRVHQALPLS